MVIKILSSSGNMPGVKYNTDKEKEKIATLLKFENFHAIDVKNSTPTEIQNYFKAINSTNKNIKNTQFHAMISCKGKEKSFDELTSVAEKYIKHLGYDQNPYLIYGHTDTNNNHVHIVSNRVNFEGEKINDSFEKNRTQKFIKNELNIDFSKDLSKLRFLDYSYSTLPQIKLLFEQYDFKVISKSKDYLIYSGGDKVANFSKSDFEKNKTTFSKDDKLKNKLSALFYKYKKEYSPEEFKNFMRQNFGVQIILHYPKTLEPKVPTERKQNIRPYGYTVIDHTNKRIYKGSEIAPLVFIENKLTKEGHIKEFENLFEKYHKPNQSLYDLNQLFKDNNISIDFRGIVKSKALNEDIAQLSRPVIKDLLYFNKTHLLNSYNFKSEISKEFALSFFKVKEDHINKDVGISDELNQYMVQNFKYIFDQTSSIEKLQENKIYIYKYQNSYQLLDYNQKVVYEIPDIYHNAIHNHDPKIYEDYTMGNQEIDFDKISRAHPNDNYESKDEMQNIDQLEAHSKFLGVTSDLEEDDEYIKPKNKKKKKRPNINNNLEQ